MRPVEGKKYSDGTYELIAPSEYDPDDEVWEFLPGEIVRTRTETINGKYYDVAFARAY